jgi:hypothetical protein
MHRGPPAPRLKEHTTQVAASSNPHAVGLERSPGPRGGRDRFAGGAIGAVAVSLGRRSIMLLMLLSWCRRR